MKRLMVPATLLAVFVGANVLLDPGSGKQDVRVEDYAFNPTTLSRSLCGPSGIKHGLLFRPELARLFASAANASDAASTDVPLFDGLDGRDFPISSNNGAARAYFRQGFALLYGFNHWEAIRAFRVAQSLDPNCAICFWGEAIALGPNINAPMDAESGERALAAINTAMALRDGADVRERAMIEAAALRYSDAPEKSRADLDKAYASAMADLHAAYPDDQDIATLYAEAIMDTSPWDYWERDFATPKPHIAVAINVIDAILAENPDHYGAIHLKIHLYEASNRAEEAAPFADRLAGLAPGSGHLVHMPGHIYFRIGRYLDSLDTNIKAVAVDEAYLAATTGSPLYRYGYYPHNVHFVLVSAQMADDRATSMEYAEKLDSLIPIEVLAQAAWIAPIKAAPYFAFAQFGAVEDVASLPDPGDSVPYLKAMWHYARGKVFAEAGDSRAAAEQQAIEALIEVDAIKNAGIPAATVLRIAANIVAAKRLTVAGDHVGAVSLLAATVALQDSLSYTEPPFWYYAMEQSLGAAHFMAGDYTAAEQAFKDSLVRHPNSAGSLFGLWQTQEKLGLDAEADFTRKLYLQACRGDTEPSLLKL